jgi:hypothetical protein
MNRFSIAIALTVALGLLVGCASGPDQDQRCETYAEVYSLYLASTEVRPVSHEEIAAATAAALFLKTYCGWTATRAVDANGVPILYPPSN